jgi:hypothetical protein
MSAFIEKLRKAVRKGDDKEVKRISQLEADLPKVPHLPTLFSNDATPKRLEVLLQENSGRIALISDEGGPFDVMNGRYSQRPNL